MKTPHKVSVAAARSCVPHTCVSRQVCGGRERRGSGTFTLRLHSCVSRVRSGGEGGNSNFDSTRAGPEGKGGRGGTPTRTPHLRVQGRVECKLRLYTCVSKGKENSSSDSTPVFPGGGRGGIQTPTTPACKSQAFDSAEIFGSGPAPVVANQIRNKSRQHPKVFPGGPPPQY